MPNSKKIRHRRNIKKPFQKLSMYYNLTSFVTSLEIFANLNDDLQILLLRMMTSFHCCWRKALNLLRATSNTFINPIFMLVQVVSVLWERIWIVNAQEICCQAVCSCIRCFECKPLVLTRKLGSLTADRCRTPRPFVMCGVDFYCPVYTKLKIRGRLSYKYHIALFMFFVSKAVHLEVVSDSFYYAFKCSLVAEDVRRPCTATNIFEASCQFDNLQFASKSECEFAFTPPRTPYMGGRCQVCKAPTYAGSA